MVPKGTVVSPLLEKVSVSQKPMTPPNLQTSFSGASQSACMKGGLLNEYFLHKGYAETTFRQKKEFPERIIKYKIG